MDLPESLVIQYFFQYSGYPEYNRTAGVYNACCPVCREGKSWGKKKRLFFVPSKNKLYCHNCQRGWNPVSWIQEVSGKSFFEIMEEASLCEFIPIEMKKTQEKVVKKNDNPLPINSINLFNQTELQYYHDNKIVQDAIKFIERRRLNTALNKVDLFLSLRDYTYKNRITIPFRELNNKIIFYQCRALYKDDEEDGRKYISKINSEISIFNVDKIDVDFPYIFQFEGPIDSMFVKNGVGMAGLTYTSTQKRQLERFLAHKRIWVLDNQRIDDAGKKKAIELVKRKETVFVWPKEFANYKDLNDLCVDRKLDFIDPKTIINNCVDNEVAFNVANM